MDNLENRSVFITGAGSGIGYQIALAFARTQANIIATDIDLAGLEALNAEPEIDNNRFKKYLLDVRDADAYRTLVENLTQTGDIPDIIVNNAGLGVFRSFTDTSLQDWKLTIDVNIMGVVHGCKLFSDIWLKQNTAGHIVNLSSMASLAPIPNMSAYVASKMAVEGLSDVLNMEFADTKISVTCVHPGIIDTAIMRHNDRYGFSENRIARVQKYYREKGISPHIVAQDIVKAVTKKTTTVLTGTDTLKVILGRKLLPKSAYLKTIIHEARKIGFLPYKNSGE